MPRRLLALALLVLAMPGAGAAQDTTVGAVHPSGAQVVVQQVELLEQGLRLHVAMTGGPSLTVFNAGGENVSLTAPTGDPLVFVPPPDNPELEVETGETLEQWLLFSGPVAPATDRLLLVLNETGDPASPATDVPQFTIEIALPPTRA